MKLEDALRKTNMSKSVKGDCEIAYCKNSGQLYVITDDEDEKVCAECVITYAERISVIPYTA